MKTLFDLNFYEAVALEGGGELIIQFNALTLAQLKLIKSVLTASRQWSYAALSSRFKSDTDWLIKMGGYTREVAEREVQKQYQSIDDDLFANALLIALLNSNFDETVTDDAIIIGFKESVLGELPPPVIPDEYWDEYQQVNTQRAVNLQIKENPPTPSNPVERKLGLINALITPQSQLKAYKAVMKVFNQILTNPMVKGGLRGNLREGFRSGALDAGVSNPPLPRRRESKGRKNAATRKRV